MELTVKNAKIFVAGNGYGVRIPKSFVKNGLLDVHIQYDLVITPTKQDNVQNDDQDMPKKDGIKPEPIESENGNPQINN